MDKIVVTLVGVGLISFIWWFFFGKKSSSIELDSVTQDGVNILVDGGYQPSVIKLHKGKPTVLKITRKDANSCLEEIVLPDFKIKKYLPLNETIEINIKPTKTGEFPFHCGMNMFHGKIIVT